MNTQSANAAVVESEPVGGSKPGITVPRLAKATNKKSVPRKGRYLFGCPRPTSVICFTMPVTIISSVDCQRDMLPVVTSLRVINLAASDITIIMIQVLTIVPLSLTNPCCHRICWSELRFTGPFLGRSEFWCPAAHASATLQLCGQ